VGVYYSAVRSVARAFFGVTGLEVKGIEHVPLDGGVIVASNHVSFWDPPIVGSVLPRESHFLAKTELFATPGLSGLIRSLNAIPIRRGAVDLTGLSRAIGVLKDGGGLLMFPEGSRMRDGALHPARPGVGMVAVQADVPIVPCYISGSNRPSRWLTGRGRARLWFGAVRDWRDLAGPEEDRTPGRALYQRIGDALMREIAGLKAEQEQSASRGAA